MAPPDAHDPAADCPGRDQPGTEGPPPARPAVTGDASPGHQSARARHALELVLSDVAEGAAQHELDLPLSHYVATFLESLYRFGTAARGVAGLDAEVVERLARRAAYDADFELGFRALIGAPLTTQEVADLGGTLSTREAVEAADLAGNVIGFGDGPLRRYPAGQFSDGQPIPDLARVLEEFRRQDHQAGERSIVVWLFSPNEHLGEETPVQRLRADGRAGVELVQAAFRRAATWAR